MDKVRKYIFGPIPSRRLGLSLGVDIVPHKVCTLDCVYCQVGETTELTIERKEYIEVEAVLSELKKRLAEPVKADYITISGSGEPTLNSKLGLIIEQIKKITDIPVAVLTNGTLLTEPAVREDCAKADVVLPSLDAGDEQAFEKINHPHKNLSVQGLIDGLCKFREEFSGQIWLEVFLVEDLNTDIEQIAKIKKAIKRIGPDKIQLNTAVRPTSQKGVKRIDKQKLEAIAAQLGENCEIIADFSSAQPGKYVQNEAQQMQTSEFDLDAVLSMLKRRPCSLEDICSGLNIAKDQALHYIDQLQEQGVVGCEEKDGTVFFMANH